MQSQTEEFPDFTVYIVELIRRSLLLYSLKLKGTQENLSFSKVITVALELTLLMLMCLVWRREYNDDDSSKSKNGYNKGVMCWSYVLELCAGVMCWSYVLETHTINNIGNYYKQHEMCLLLQFFIIYFNASVL
jgi:hypothetical protein